MFGILNMSFLACEKLQVWTLKLNILYVRLKPNKQPNDTDSSL